MEPLAILLALILVLGPTILSLVAFTRTSEQRRQLERLTRELGRLKSQLQPSTDTEPAPLPASQESAGKPPAAEEARKPGASPPPLPTAHPQSEHSSAPPAEGKREPEPSGIALPGMARQSAAPTPPRPRAVRAPRDLETFLGKQLFAWIGGIALFFAIALFVQYSFKNGLISREVRVALGYLTGTVALIVGMRLPRPRYEVGVHALISAGLLICGATTWTAHALYDFIGQVPAFLLLVLITAAAFLISVRFRSQTVAILGLVAGFITPILVSTGQDSTLALFLYLGVLNAGIVAVVLRRPDWPHLLALGWGGTLLMQLGWLVKFGLKHPVWHGYLIFFLFAALFNTALWILERHGSLERTGTKRHWTFLAALGSVALAYLFGLISIAAKTNLAASAPVFLGYVFATDVILLASTWFLGRVWRLAPVVFSGAIVLLLAVWMGSTLREVDLGWALLAAVIAAAGHTAYHIAFERRHGTNQPGPLTHLAPTLALAALLVPLGQATEAPLLLWLTVGLIALVSLAAAVFSGSTLAVCGSIAAALLVGAVWLLSVPAASLSLFEFWLMSAGFGVLFFGVSVWLAPKILAKLRESVPATETSPKGWIAELTDPRSLLPVISAGFPFFLVYIVIVKLPMANPAPFFGVLLVLSLLMLGVVSRGWIPALAPVTLGAVFVGEGLWHSQSFDPAHATGPLLWYAGFGLLFTVFPFLFSATLGPRRFPWAAAACSLPLHFLLIHSLVARAWPNNMMGLVPLVHALPAFLAVLALVRLPELDAAARRHHLSFFGGAALLFITLVFPIQFNREWITLAWAMEGAALLWLYRRLGHPGLRWVAAALFVVAFLRLAVNPKVLIYHERSPNILFNWILYTYGLAIAAFATGAWFARPPHHLLRGVSLRGWLSGLAVMLGFLLLNLLVTHAFSPGRMIEFDFSAALGRDMTYSIVWALYASAILAAGFRWRLSAARYAGLGLLCVTIAKIFLHDLWSLGGLYRIGSFIGLALVLIAVSFVYQRVFAAAPEDRNPGEDHD
ncbi:MAG: DUF2339 domain-containing protein [Verrucomicrobiales bacterium]